MAIKFLYPGLSHIKLPGTNETDSTDILTPLTELGHVLPSSQEVTGLELRLLPPFIIENNTKQVFPFPGRARLYCLTVVVSDVNNQLAGGIDLQGFPRIGDQEYLPLNKTIFYWQQDDKRVVAPTQLHTFCSVIKSKRSLRDVGKILTNLKTDESYKGILQNLSQLATNASTTGVALNLVTQIASVVGRYLGEVEDKPLGTFVNSYTTLHGDFDKNGISRQLFQTQKVNFELELTVRRGMQSAIAGGKKEKPVEVGMMEMG